MTATDTPQALPPSRQERGSSADIVFDGLVQGLYEGRYAPGQRLAEVDLTTTYGVSRGSVREALNRLAAAGIITLNLHRGAQIRSLTRSDVASILDVLELMIGLAGRLAARRIDEGDNRAAFEAVTTGLLDYRGATGSFNYLRTRNRFYRILVDIGGNLELARTLRSIQVHLIRVQLRSDRIEATRSMDYRAISKAVLAGDEAAAERACRRHVQHVAKAIRELSDHAFAVETNGA